MAIDVFPQPVPYNKRPLPPAASISQTPTPDVKALHKGASTLTDFLTRELGFVERSIAASGTTPSRTVTSDTTATGSDGFFAVDATSGAVTITLPDALRYAGRIFYVKKVDASANAVTVVPSGTDLIDGAASVALSTQYESAELYARADGWSVLSQANILAPSGISGSGTIGTLPVFTAAQVIGDSIIAQSGGTATITGSLLATANVTANGNLSVLGNATLGNAITDTTAIAGPTTIGATLDVAGDTTLGNATSDSAISSGTLWAQYQSNFYPSTKSNPRTGANSWGTAIPNIANALVAFGTTSSERAMLFLHAEAGTEGPLLFLGKTRGTDPGVLAAVSSGDNLGTLSMRGAATSTAALEGFRMNARVNGAVSATSLPTDVYIGTHNGTTLADRWLWQAAGHYVPNAAATYDVGSTSARVLGGYFTTLSASGTGALPLALARPASSSTVAMSFANITATFYAGMDSNEAWAIGANNDLTISPWMTLTSALLTTTGLTATGAVSLSPANANVTISPTGTGTVTLAPTTAGTADNIVIGGVTPLAGTFTNIAGTIITPTQNSVTTMTGLTTIGTLIAGAVPASLVTAGTFGAGAYTFPSTIHVTTNATVGGTLGVTGVVTGGTYNGQTISSAASFTGTMAVASTLTLSNDLIMVPVSNIAEVRTNTTDGSDTAQFSLTPASSPSNTRGALVSLYGNEHATQPGRAQISTGNVSGADLVLQWGGNAAMTITRPSANLIAFTGDATISATLAVTTSVTSALLAGTTRVTSPLLGTTTAVDVVFDRNSVTQLTLGSLAATFAGTAQATSLFATTRVTAPLIGTTTATDVVFDRNSVTQLTLTSLVAVFAGTVITNTGSLTAGSSSDMSVRSGGALRQTFLYGGNTTTSAHIILSGQSATDANDIQFNVGAGGRRGHWDDSAALWEFSNATSALVRFATPAAGETALYVYDADNATLERVTVGVADSGGVGYKVLRVPN